MSEIILTDGSAKLYEYEQLKPELVDVLEHHGILGMRWGARNGPPYPLGSGDHSSSEKKAGWRKSLGGGSEDSAKRKRSRALKKARKTRARNIKRRTLEKKQQQKIQKTKEEIIKSKDINAMLKNVDKFTNSEINDLLTRLDVESRLRNKANAMNEANKPLIKKFLKSVKDESVAGALSAGKQLIRKGSGEGLKIVTRKLFEDMVDPNSEAPDGRKWKDIINSMYGAQAKKEARRK